MSPKNSAEQMAPAPSLWQRRILFITAALATETGLGIRQGYEFLLPITRRTDNPII